LVGWLVGSTLTLPLYPRFDFRFPVTPPSQQWWKKEEGCEAGEGGPRGIWEWGVVSPPAAHDQVVPLADCSVAHFRRWPGSGCPCSHRPVEQRAVGHAGVSACGGRGSGVCCRRAGGAWGLREPWKLPGPASGEVRRDPRPCPIPCFSAQKMRTQKTQQLLNLELPVDSAIIPSRLEAAAKMPVYCVRGDARRGLTWIPRCL
jgi:hypothetical protein